MPGDEPGSFQVPGASIDLWNPATFDPELSAVLTGRADLLRAYVTEDALVEQEYAADRMQMLRRSNRHWDAYQRLEQDLDALLRTRVARAWHYTRLTDAEAQRIAAEGPGLSTLEAFRDRLQAQVQANTLTEDQVEAIFAASALAGSQHNGRAGQFCTTAVPFPITYPGILKLLGHWGGEAAAFHLQDATLRAHLRTIGRPRVLEIAFPLSTARPTTSIAKAGMAAFAHQQGIEFDAFMVDLFAVRALGPGAVLAVHTEGDATFAALGRTYPTDV